VPWRAQRARPLGLSYIDKVRALSRRGAISLRQQRKFGKARRFLRRIRWHRLTGACWGGTVHGNHSTGGTADKMSGGKSPPWRPLLGATERRPPPWQFCLSPAPSNFPPCVYVYGSGTQPGGPRGLSGSLRPHPEALEGRTGAGDWARNLLRLRAGYLAAAYQRLCGVL
jgi:hypothetical protein